MDEKWCYYSLLPSPLDYIEEEEEEVENEIDKVVERGRD